MQSSIFAPEKKPEQPQSRLPYWPGLDGLRALAVVAVLLYHAGFTLWGGFLGVETFFTLSGFLITGLLLMEWRRDGRIDLRTFWIRRARRLLPALFLVLGGIVILVRLLPGGQPSALPGDIVASLAYVMNWHLIASERSYFDPMLRPSLLQHLWSLAVEEQFYIVWPLLFVVGARLLRMRGLLVLTLGVAAASAWLMARLFEPGADPSRIYYGTDTRAAGLLLGAAFALVWMPRGHVPVLFRGAGLLLDATGLLALAGLLAAYIWLFETHWLLYRGGFLFVSVCTLLVIAAITHPQARLIRWLMERRLLRWIGLRSYSIYLWHWPVFMVTRPYADVPFDGYTLLALRMALVIPLAALSYHFVEMPIRHGALERAWNRWRTPGEWTGVGVPLALNTNNAIIGSKGLRGRRWFVLISLMLLSIGSCATPAAVPPQGVAESAEPPLVSPVEEQPSPTIAPSTATETPTPEATSAIAAKGAEAEQLPTTEAASVATTSTPAIEAPDAASSPTTSVEAETSPDSIPTPTPALADMVEEPPVVDLLEIDAELAAELQRILDAHVANRFIPGVVLAVNLPGYEPWVGASGIADVQQGIAMQPDTRYRIASISKMFTAVVVLQLVEEGVIALDVPVETWLPGQVPSGHVITVRQLLNHTSGLYDYLEDRIFVTQSYQNPDRTWRPDELVGYAARFPLSFRPGTADNWDYSSTNYVVLGMLVEQVTGNTLAQEMRARVFEPLGLEQTYFAPDEAIQGAMATGYTEQVIRRSVSMSFGFATANLVSTTHDIQQFAHALFSGELLSAESMAMMTTFVNGKGQYNMPELEYGFGVMRNRLPVGPGPAREPRPATASTVLGHIGGFGGFRSAVWFAPEHGATIALAMNQGATDPNNLALPVMEAILASQGR